MNFQLSEALQSGLCATLQLKSLPDEFQSDVASAFMITLIVTVVAGTIDRNGRRCEMSRSPGRFCYLRSREPMWHFAVAAARTI
jgi:hypothetical protein